MSTGILLVTHPGIGDTLLENARRLLGDCPARVRSLGIPLDGEREQLMKDALTTARALDDGSGILILTDAFGATPSNIACELTREMQANVVSGLNLPMLIRVFNYSDDDLAALTRKAEEGGMRGIQVSTAPGEEA